MRGGRGGIIFISDGWPGGSSHETWNIGINGKEKIKGKRGGSLITTNKKHREEIEIERQRNI